MQISMKCSVAVHCLIFIHEAKGVAKVTSNLLAQSTGCNPVGIRNVISGLKKAGLEPDGLSELIGIHACQGRKCPIAQNIGQVLQKPYQQIEDAIKQTMESITLQSMIDDFHQLVQKPE